MYNKCTTWLFIYLQSSNGGGGGVGLPQPVSDWLTSTARCVPRGEPEKQTNQLSVQRSCKQNACWWRKICCQSHTHTHTLYTHTRTGVIRIEMNQLADDRLEHQPRDGGREYIKACGEKPAGPSGGRRNTDTFTLRYFKRSRGSRRKMHQDAEDGGLG